MLGISALDFSVKEFLKRHFFEMPSEKDLMNEFKVLTAELKGQNEKIERMLTEIDQINMDIEKLRSEGKLKSVEGDK